LGEAPEEDNYIVRLDVELELDEGDLKVIKSFSAFPHLEL
jgi:hypothetical protein